MSTIYSIVEYYFYTDSHILHRNLWLVNIPNLGNSDDARFGVWLDGEEILAGPGGDIVHDVVGLEGGADEVPVHANTND
jgi:hypothetical protein